jgi:hypothetical protein
VLPLALGDAEFDEARTLDRHRSPVHAAEHPECLECVEVAADRLGRDVEVVGEVRDGHPSGGVHGGGDRVVAFGCVHARTPSFPLVLSTVRRKPT